jgi:hypothetical protein
MKTEQTSPVLVVKGSGGGGLGDRILSVLLGILYCRLSGRALYIDWTDGLLAERGMNVFAELFSILGIEVFTTLPEQECSVYPPSWKGRLGQSLHELYVEDGNPPWNRSATIQRYSFDLGELHYSEKILVMWDFDQLEKLRPYLAPELSGCSREKIFREIYQSHLIPNPSLVAEAEHWVPSDKGHTIGVHVRATYESFRQKGRVRLSDYFRTVDTLSAALHISRIVLATDNQEVEEKFRCRYQNVIARHKWFSRPGEPLHLHSVSPDRLQNTRDALVEILMLAHCEHLITQQNSSFSMIARSASRAPAENVLALYPRMPLWERTMKYCKRVLP